MKRVLAALLIAALSLVRPAYALPQDPAVAAMQDALADVGRWSLEQQSAMQLAVQPLVEISTYVAILDRFTNGDLNQRNAITELEGWRAGALQTIGQARAAAAALRPPPSLAQFGPSGAALEQAMNAARDGLVPTIHELERVVNACADLGLAAVRDPGKGYDARQRAMLQAQMQLVRVDLNRLRLTGASMPVEHPNHAFLAAMQHYYQALVVVPEYALADLDGDADRPALIASLRQSSRQLRAEVTRAAALSQTLRVQLNAQLAREAPAILRAGQQMLDSFPASIRAFNGLADNIDRVAAEIEQGGDVLDVWAESESWDQPHLAELDRLDRMRAQLLANINGAPL